MAGKEKPSTAPEGDRIAKVLSRRGVASRREAERLIEAGEVKVNGKIITSAALNVTARDVITVSGQPLPEEEPARLWLYYKPDGLVTSAADEKGRDTIFDHLPEDMPRVMSIGRLDLTSEGLLLLTNDGELKRRLELPSTGWLRKYRVRLKGNPTDPELEPLRKGVEIEGERFLPMDVTLDRHQGANAWLTIGLREGRNREIRRAVESIGFQVNRLIRVSYGPFRLGELKPGEVEEVRAKVLREQLGEGGNDEPAKPVRTRTRSTTAAKTAPRAKGRGADAIGDLAAAWDSATRRPARSGSAKPAAGAKPVSRTAPDAERASARKPAPPRREDEAPRRAAPGKAPSRRMAEDEAPRRPSAPKAASPRGRKADDPVSAPRKATVARDADAPRRAAPGKAPSRHMAEDDAPRRPSAPKAASPRSTEDDRAGRRGPAPKPRGPAEGVAPKPRGDRPSPPKGPKPPSAGKPGGRTPSGKPRSRG